MEALSLPLMDNAIPEEAVWQCTTCGWCVEGCPVLIEHVDSIVEIRRNLVLEESRFPKELNAAFRNMETAGNPWGQPRSARLDWAKGLDVPVLGGTDAPRPLGRSDGRPWRTIYDHSRPAPARRTVLYWVGCAGAFDDRNRKVVRAMAALLKQAEVPFAVLGTRETCTGDPARRAGNEYLFQMLAEENVATLTAAHDDHSVRTIVASCPHCFNTIRNEYPQFGLSGVEVIHHTQLLDTLVADGRLIPDRSNEALVAYHDACYLGRYNEVYDEGRRVVESVPGQTVVEMEQHHRKGLCCGAGGARMWMEEREGQRINHSRVSQALAVSPTRSRRHARSAWSCCATGRPTSTGPMSPCATWPSFWPMPPAPGSVTWALRAKQPNRLIRTLSERADEGRAGGRASARPHRPIRTLSERADEGPVSVAHIGVPHWPIRTLSERSENPPSQMPESAGRAGQKSTESEEPCGIRKIRCQSLRKVDRALVAEVTFAAWRWSAIRCCCGGGGAA